MARAYVKLRFTIRHPYKKMKLTLLTHQKEFDRPNNTGALCEALDNVMTQRTLWKRTEPDQALIHSLELGAVLLSPFGHGEQVADINNVDQAT